MIFVIPISSYIVEPGTLEKAGQILLTKFGLHNYLQDQVVHCKLYVSSLFLHCYLFFFVSSHAQAQAWSAWWTLPISWSWASIIGFNAMLSASWHVSHQVIIQNMVCLGITFYTTAHGSTQGPTHARWCDLGYASHFFHWWFALQYIKLKHVQVFWRSQNTWDRKSVV